MLSFRKAYNNCDIIFSSKFTTIKNPVWTSLRPHELESWVILIKSENMLNIDSSMLHVVLSIHILWIICAAFRCFFRKFTNSPHHSFGDAIMDTLGMFLSTNNTMRIRNRPERVMNISILLLSIIISRLFTALLLNYMLANEIDSGINSIYELGQSPAPIFISDEMKLTMDEWLQTIELSGCSSFVIWH